MSKHKFNLFVRQFAWAFVWVIFCPEMFSFENWKDGSSMFLSGLLMYMASGFMLRRCIDGSHGAGGIPKNNIRLLFARSALITRGYQYLTDIRSLVCWLKYFVRTGKNDKDVLTFGMMMLRVWRRSLMVMSCK